MICYHSCRQVGLFIVVERIAASQRAELAPQRAKSSVEVYQSRTWRIVKIFPVDIAPERDAPSTARRQRPVVRELLRLPKHRNSLASIEGDRKGLQLEEFSSIAKRHIIWVIPGLSDEADQLAVVVRFEVLKWRDRHIDRIPCQIPDAFRIGITEKPWIQQVGEIIIDKMAPAAIATIDSRKAITTWMIFEIRTRDGECL